MDSFAIYAHSCQICPLEFFIVFLGRRNNKKFQQMNPSLMIAHGECERRGTIWLCSSNFRFFLVSCLLFAFDYRNCTVTKLKDILRTPHSGFQKILLNSLPNFLTHSARARTPLSRGNHLGGGGWVMLCYFLWQYCYIKPNDIRRSGVT